MYMWIDTYSPGTAYACLDQVQEISWTLSKVYASLKHATFDLCSTFRLNQGRGELHTLVSCQTREWSNQLTVQLFIARL